MSEDAQFTHAHMVRFERLMPGPVERTWQVLTDVGQLPGWYGEGRIDSRIGGAVELMGGHIRGTISTLVLLSEVIGSVELGGNTLPVPRYSAILPTPEFKADLDWSCLTAGECAADIHAIEPAGEIVRRMTADASRILEQLSREVA
jgi:hypothetical protein